MYHMLWGIRQHREIAEAQGQASRASSKARDVETQVRDLRAGMDKMMLINRALWEFIQKATGLSEDDLVQKVNEIDLRDGVLDGKITKEVRTCPSCNRTLYRGHRKCLYCGAEDPDLDPFDVAR